MKIKVMTGRHREEVLGMMRVFYASPAVATNGSEEIFRADFDACVGPNPYLEGYVLTEDTALIGYAMVAKSFSTEYGCPCIALHQREVPGGDHAPGSGGGKPPRGACLPKKRLRGDAVY